MADQLTTADKQRFSNFISNVSAQEMKQIENTIQIQLGMKK
jgi:mRNA-degrading endonuclease toxin of MazEF toxin-antitoxin module